MKKLLAKIPAMIAILITFFSIYLCIMGYIDPESELWVVSVIVAILSMVFYFIDAIISFVRAVKKDDAKFNYILTVVLIGAIPMLVIFAGSGREIFNVIWNAYYLTMVVLELISIKKAWAAMKATRKKAKESPEN